MSTLNFRDFNKAMEYCNQLKKEGHKAFIQEFIDKDGWIYSVTIYG